MKKNVLICPLDWGIGHASRCIPLIERLKENGFNVIIAADKRPLALLKREFPSHTFIRFPGTRISYPDKGSMAIKMLTSIPKILKSIHVEHYQLKKIIKEYDIEVVISDNRFGLWNRNVESIYITHQLMIKCPKSLKLFEPFLLILNRFFFSKYDECWVPDYEGKINLSADLSHKYPISSHTHFIGPLSRFFHEDSDLESITEDESGFDVFVMLSGPEPQRTMLEEKMINQLKGSDLSAVMVRGIAEEDTEIKITPNIKMFSHLSSSKMKENIKKARLVICRPGYSSIMDLVALGANAAFIPTPGQTEQEYLAKYYKENNVYNAVSQKKLDILSLVEESKEYSGVTLRYNDGLLNERIKILKYRLD